MKKYFEYVRRDRLIFRLFTSAFVSLLVTAIISLISFPKLPPLIPIFNQLPWGPERLSGNFGIFIPSLLVFVISILNLILCGYIYSNSALLSRIFAFTTFLLSLLNFLFVVRTVLLIT